MMKQSDVQKLLEKGFTVIRTANIFPQGHQKKKTFQIKAKTKDKPEWFLLEKEIPNQTQLEKKVAELLKDKMTVLEA